MVDFEQFYNNYTKRVFRGTTLYRGTSTFLSKIVKTMIRSTSVVFLRFYFKNIQFGITRKYSRSKSGFSISKLQERYIFSNAGQGIYLSVYTIQ